MKTNDAPRRGFTIVELLVVIGILLVLTLATIYFLNPAALQSEGRDNNRISDLTTLNQSVALYHETNPAGSLGASGVMYVSVPDPTATSTAGDQCQGLGLSAVSGYTYHCADLSAYRNIDGTGWIPIDFSGVAGISLATLPIDPVNTTSSGEYYIYVANGTQYELWGNPESPKTASSSLALGNDPGLVSSGGGTITFTTSTYALGSSLGPVAFDSNTNTMWAFGGSNILTQFNDTTYATTTHVVMSASESLGYGMVFDPHTNTMWALDNTIGGFIKINDTTYATSTYPMGGDIATIAFDSHTDTIWGANNSNNTVVKINDSTYATSTYSVGAQPYNVTFDPHTNTIWVANYGDDTLSEINDTTFTITSHPAVYNWDLAFDSNTNSIWGPNVAPGSVVLQTNDTTYATSTCALTLSPYDIVFDPHTDSMWIPNHDTNQITQVNDSTCASTIYPGGSQPSAALFDSHTNTIWIPNVGDNTFTIFTPSR